MIELAKQEGHRFGCHPFTVIRALRGFYGSDRILNELLTALSEKHSKPFTTEEDAIELMAIHDKEKHYTDTSRFPYPCYKDDEEQNT
ncbi:hypothetical protein SAMN05421647_11476 [Marinobacterium stanieri]|uniref:Uncharacterized protein n=1 Tax=Marinobacterium stanieri TaxID=49186 RepID=A0A1N6XKJ6_9GAMM|nr:hypothetical protein SAMN05421647_11476 [Marinobacterium stanieri]